MQKSSSVKCLTNPVKSIVSGDEKIANQIENPTSMEGVGILVFGMRKREVTHLAGITPRKNVLPIVPAECFSTGACRNRDKL